MATKTVDVPHLGGIKAGYAFAAPYDASKPTVVLVNSMCTTTALYRDQFSSQKLTAAVNLLAIEPLGHGATSSATEHFTYWDTAIMNLQVMDKLGIEKAFALGTSQGGWMVTRMALLAPDRILGLMPLGTSLTYESSHSRSLGAWNPAEALVPFYKAWSSPVPTPDWVVDDIWCGMVGTLGFGSVTTEEKKEFWTKTLKDIYQGDEGRRKIRIAVICLLERDGLELRLPDVKCPVHWLQGSEDVVYPPAVAEEQVKLFTGSADVKFDIIQGGAHYLNATSPVEVETALLALVEKYAK